MGMEWKVPDVRQSGEADCIAATTGVMEGWLTGGPADMTPVLRELSPLRDKETGEELGNVLSLSAVYFQQRGYRAMLEVQDLVLFDYAWSQLRGEELKRQLRKRAAYLESLPPLQRHSVLNGDLLWTIVEAYEQAIDLDILVPPQTERIFDSSSFWELLAHGPFILAVNYNVLHGTPKAAVSHGVASHDPIRGALSSHVVAVYGYERDVFLVQDTDITHGGQITVPEARLIAAAYTTMEQGDTALLTVRPQL
jgi:hypothetical protein